MNKHVRILIIFTILYLVVGLIYITITYAFRDILTPSSIKENMPTVLLYQVVSWPTLFLHHSASWASFFGYSSGHKIYAIIIIGIIEISLVVISRQMKIPTAASCGVSS
jgi:hypothetical protein